ncbi:hypothetical protein FKM82_011094 [Ascaphus truei]
MKPYGFLSLVLLKVSTLFTLTISGKTIPYLSQCCKIYMFLEDLSFCCTIYILEVGDRLSLYPSFSSLLSGFTIFPLTEFANILALLLPFPPGYLHIAVALALRTGRAVQISSNQCP